MTISNFELAKLAKKHKINLTLEDIISSDELQHRPLQNGPCIINLQDSRGNGQRSLYILNNVSISIALVLFLTEM